MIFVVVSSIISILVIWFALQEIELRKHARNESRRYCDPVVLTYQAERMPEQIRLKVKEGLHYNVKTLTGEEIICLMFNVQGPRLEINIISICHFTVAGIRLWGSVLKWRQFLFPFFLPFDFSVKTMTHVWRIFCQNYRLKRYIPLCGI